MENTMFKINKMVLIGATGQNCGKTMLAEKMISKWSPQLPIVALKVTTIHYRGGGCHRGIHGCGVCSKICDGYDLVMERDPYNPKDTSLLLNAGASQVFWLRAHMDAVAEGFADFLSRSMDDALIVCESNSLRQFVEPAVFIMMDNEKKTDMKPSAIAVYDLADMCIRRMQDQDKAVKKAESLIPDLRDNVNVKTYFYRKTLDKPAVLGSF